MDQERAQNRIQTDQIISDLNKTKAELEQKLSAKKLQCQQLKQLRGSSSADDVIRVTLEVANLEKQVQHIAASNALEISRVVQESQLRYEGALQAQEERHVNSMTTNNNAAWSAMSDMAKGHNETLLSLTATFSENLTEKDKRSAEGMQHVAAVIDKSFHQIENISASHNDALRFICEERKAEVAELRRIDEARAIRDEARDRNDAARLIRDEERDRKFQTAVETFNQTATMVCLFSDFVFFVLMLQHRCITIIFKLRTVLKAVWKKRLRPHFGLRAQSECVMPKKRHDLPKHSGRET